MAQFRHLLTGWLAGEIAPGLMGRVETDQYRYGLETCENWIPTIEGPLVKRQGFVRVCEAGATASWLTGFRRSIDQEYVIEWLDEAARFYTNGGRIETSPGVAYEIATPYTALEAPQLSLQQSFDRLYIDHVAHPPAAIRRDDALTFAHEETELLNGPFADANSDSAVTVTASGTTGAITLSASTAIFAAGHIGSLFRIEARDFGDVPAWEAGMKDISAGDKCQNEGKVYVADTSGTTGQVQPTHSEGSYYDGQLTNDLLNDKGPYGVKWRYLHDRFGIVKITAVGGGGTTADAAVQRRLPDSLASVASWRWTHAAFSAEAGWPHLVTLWKGRLIHFKDFDILGSVVGDYGGGRTNFAAYSDVGTPTPDLAFRRTIATENPPLWLANDRRLIIGTASRELAIGPVNAAQAVSGENIQADDQSFYGSEPIAPVQAGTETIFIERGGRRIRSADFDFARDRYDAADLTAAARHITGGGLVQLAYQRNPQALVLGVRTDGQIVVHPKSREEIKGFARYRLGGAAVCKSAVSIVGEDARSDELWLLVERTAGDGSALREIWRQAPWRELGDAQDEAFYVDGGIRIEAAAGQTEFTGLDHLAGQAVAVLANGGVVPGRTVSDDGVLTLPGTSVPKDKDFVVIVGLAYSAIAVGLRPEFTLRGMSVQGMLKVIKKITLRLLETVGIKVGQLDRNEPDGGFLEELIDRAGNDRMDAPIPLVTGDKEGLVDAGFDRDGAPRWISDAPLPATVAAAIVELEVG